MAVLLGLNLGLRCNSCKLANHFHSFLLIFLRGQQDDITIKEEETKDFEEKGFS